MYSIDPESGAFELLSQASDSLAMVRGSSSSNYAFSSFRIRRDKQFLELDADGRFVPSIATNDICADPECKGARLSFAARGAEQHYLHGGENPQTVMRLNAADRRQGSGLVSITQDGQAYFLSSEGRNLLALSRTDLASGTETVLHEGHSDILSVSLNPLSKKPQFVETDDSSRRVIALDADTTRTLELLKQLGGGDAHIINRAPSDKYWLVSFPETVQAPKLALFDRDQRSLRTLTAVGASFRGRVSWHTERGVQVSSGGLHIPYVLLTPIECPASTCPLVVLLHGGPAARDTGNIDRERQILLDRGYAILMINYRGSKGFGKAYEQLDQGEWYKGIPEDVKTTLHALQASGVANRERIAFVGTSFAAYLALNLIADGEAASCAVVDSGALDLPVFVAEEMEKARAKGAISDLLERVGDPRIEAQRFVMAAGSPANKTEALARIPILHLHGGQDSIVNIAQARAFAAQMQAKSKVYRYIELADQGHSLVGAREMYWNVATEFLDRCLKH
ncbi:hypothetical protein GCM10028811_09240 [Uliginosibacterium sediminicola]